MNDKNETSERMNIIQALQALKDDKKIRSHISNIMYLQLYKTLSGEFCVAVFENGVEQVQYRSFNLSFVGIDELMSDHKVWRVVEGI